jgi:hypothetical protein
VWARRSQRGVQVALILRAVAELRKKNDFSDVGDTSQCHNQPIHANAKTPGGWHAVFERK